MAHRHPGNADRYKQYLTHTGKSSARSPHSFLTKLALMLLMLCRKRRAETEEVAVLDGREEDLGEEGKLANGPLAPDGERTLGQRLEALQLQARAVSPAR